MIEHYKQKKSWKWNIHENYEPILNLTAATRLNKVGPGATKGRSST